MFTKSFPYIEKPAKSAIVASIVAVFFISGLTLCCQVGLLPGQAFKAKSHSCCASSKADHLIKAPHSKTCSCCQISKENPERVSETFESVKASGKDLVQDIMTIVSWASHPRVSLALTDLGPPRASAVAVYLQHSVLRL